MLVEPVDPSLPEVLRVEPDVHRDDRGFFLETFNAKRFSELSGLDIEFVQDNHSRSGRGVLRGIHHQLPPHSQGKLVRCATGRVFDVAIDLREGSPTLGRWSAMILDDDTHSQIWVPPGFGHGFLVLSEVADVCYKTTTFYHGESERVVAWDDPTIGIEWPEIDSPILSDRDRNAPSFADAQPTW